MSAVAVLDEWIESSTPALDALAACCESTSGMPATEVSRILRSGIDIGMRPARSLFAYGLLTLDNHREFLPPDESEAAKESPAGSNGLSQGTPFSFDDVDMEVARRVDVSVLKRLNLLPFRARGGTVSVASSTPAAQVDPRDCGEIAERLAIDESNIEFVHVIARSLGTTIERVDVARHSELIETAAGTSNEAGIALQNYHQLVLRGDTEIGNTAGQIIRDLFLQAAEKGASDIHIFGDRNARGARCYSARLRVDGDLSHVTQGPVNAPLMMSRQVGDAVTTRIAQAGDLGDNATEPRSGRFEIEIPNNRQRFDLRVEVIPMRGEGWFTVIRLLGGQQAMKMDDIYPVSESNIVAQVQSVLLNMRAGGMFLVAGATGSGKSTFLAAAMEDINSADLNLMTIENPVEYRIRGVRQIQVDPGSKKMGFVPAIESAMRLDPDVIMIGELRSKETVEIAIQAAETGHMVLSTVHVTDAASTPSRFKNLGVRPADLAFVLKGVLAQKLVRTKCLACLQQGKPPADCVFCGGQGWMGRAAVGEVMKVDESISRLIAEEAPPPDIERAANVAVKAKHAGALIAGGRTGKEEVASKLGLDDSLIAQKEAERIIAAGGIGTWRPG